MYINEPVSGDRPPGAGRLQEHWFCPKPLERGVQLAPETNSRLAQAEGVNGVTAYTSDVTADGDDVTAVAPPTARPTPPAACRVCLYGRM